MNLFKYKSKIDIPKTCSIAFLTCFMFFSSCKKLVEVDPPVTGVTGATVFNNDALAIAAVTNIYAQASQVNANLESEESLTSLSLFAGLSADEIELFNLNSSTLYRYYSNELVSKAGSNLWNTFYPIIFIANSAIEGLNNSTEVTSSVKQQLLGEARFIRAFCYFYLVNLYGDVPIVTSTDYKINSVVSRMAKADVYQQIIVDLKEAKQLLSSNYLDGTLLKTSTERVRPTKWAAAALLSRAYLFSGDWANAETEATQVISQASLYSLVGLNNVFLKNSQETIWSLQPVGVDVYANTGEGNLFVLPNTGPADFQYPVYLSDNVVNSFEANDQRKSNWVNSATVGTATYYYPYKYKIGRANVTTTKEYIMVMRLAEQYLIRAEARAHQNNLAGATDDLNMIRTRAGLPNTTASSQTELLDAIFHERQVELFTEWGNRWLDLKRTGKIDAVMSTITPQKGGTWQTTDQLYPIPQSELNANPNLVQNPGYQ